MSDAPQGPGWWQASDQRWYPPEQHPGYQQQMPPGYVPYGPPPKKSNAWWIVLLGVGGFMMIGLVGCVALVGTAVNEASNEASSPTTNADGVETNSRNQDNPPQDDVTNVQCLDESGRMQATMRVTNNSSQRSNYTIKVVFENEDGSEQLATGFEYITELESGQATSGSAQTFTEPPAEGFACRVIEVNRYAS